MRNYCYVAVCSAARGASAPTEGGEGGGMSWRPPVYSLLYFILSVLTEYDIHSSRLSFVIVIKFVQAIGDMVFKVLALESFSVAEMTVGHLLSLTRV